MRAADGARPGELLAGHPDDQEGALAAYEEEMYARSATEAAGAGQPHELMFGADSPHGLLDLLAGGGRSA